jgi:DNA-binding NtrC family response regulator
VQLLEILLAVDNEAVAQALAATLRRAGHHVTASTTIAGAVETLMRRGPHIDIIMTSTRFGSSLGDDVVQYSRKFAAHARLIVLPETTGHLDAPVDAVELLRARQPAVERPGTSDSN